MKKMKRRLIAPNRYRLAANLNVQEFIENVKVRPAIWNRFMHGGRIFVELAWKELSKIHNFPGKLISVLFSIVSDFNKMVK